MDYSIDHIEQNNALLNNLGVTIVRFSIDVPFKNITSYNQI